MTGYLGTRRNISKNLSFALLRNPSQSHEVQIVSALLNEGPDNQLLKTHETLTSLKEWTPVVITGKIKSRKPAKKKKNASENLPQAPILVDTAEMDITSIEVLNEVPADLLLKEDTVFSPEQRHLQLRTSDALRSNLAFRAELTSTARMHMSQSDFVEIETPILFKSTPEGAREFLVPTRTKGLAYALPQSPQQYKQILMASGVAGYFQFARCFRDEDLRADRQPEFTQLDIEMSFAAEEDVMAHIESLLKKLWKTSLDIDLPSTFQRMTYQEAMSMYGSDKPDVRLGMEIQSITNNLPSDLISKVTDLLNPTIDAFKLELDCDPQETQKFISDFLESPEGKPFMDNPDGQPGVFIGDAKQPMGGLGPLGYDFTMSPPAGLETQHGELLILQARENKHFSGGSTTLGNLRLALHKAAVAAGLIEPASGFRFLWIHDFPLLTPSTDTDPGQGGSAGFASTHHPFTAPKSAADVDLLLTSPSSAIAAHYDIVCNGVELGGGSRRIHNADLQEFILRDVIKMSAERLEDFRHLLDVLRSGCPPHAGIALGWDRLVAIMRGEPSLRNVIAFPKNNRGEDMLVKSPNAMTEGQLDTYHLRLKE